MTYQEFIDNIIQTRGQWNIPDGEYYEAHHIIPHCMGGEPQNRNAHNLIHENIIWLYPQEHYLAHKLLALENPENIKLVQTWVAMSHVAKDDEEYAKIREQFNLAFSGENNPFYGKHHSEEQKQKWSKDRKGKFNGTEETKKKISKANKGHKVSEENRLKLRKRMLSDKNPQKGKPLNSNQKAAITKAREEGKLKMTEEGKKRLRDRMLSDKNPTKNKFGEENPFYGKHHSEEQKQKWSEERKGKYFGTEKSKYNAILHNPNIKRILCIETQQIFLTSKDAAKFAGVDSSNIIRCCQGKSKTSGGYHWRYIDNMSYKFFQNKECEFFPCHNIENLNCLFCFCPLYNMGDNCGGNYIILDNGVKDCSQCVLPHNNYDYVINKLMEVNKTKGDDNDM